MQFTQSSEDIRHALENIGDMPVRLAERNWLIFGIATPVSGDPQA